MVVEGSDRHYVTFPARASTDNTCRGYEVSAGDLLKLFLHDVHAGSKF